MTETSIGELGEAEQLVWQAFGRGAWVDLRSGDAAADRLSLAPDWPRSRVVRAEVLAALLLGAAAPYAGGSRPALRLRGARITGRLDLTGAKVEHAVECEYCVFDEEPCFTDATTKSLRIAESALPAFEGVRLRSEGIVDLTGSVLERRLSLGGANLVGELCLRHVTVGSDPAAEAVSAEGLSVDGAVDCGAGFSCVGSFLLRGARITGALDLGEASLTAVGAPALRLDNGVIGSRLTAVRLRAAGQVRLTNTRIAGSLHLVGAQLRNPGDLALGGGGLSVGGGVWCGGSFLARGQFRLIGASIGGILCLEDADLSNPGGDAVNLDRADVGDVDCDRLCVAGGRVSMRNAQVSGRLSLAQARLDAGVGEMALAANGVVVTGSVDFRGLWARGELSLRTCRVTERILLYEAELDNAPGTALRLSRARVGADIFCGGMAVRGVLKLTGATVGSGVSLNGVTLSNPGDTALDAENLQAGTLTFQPDTRPEGRVLFRSAQLGRLRDDPETWPQELVLDGLVYHDLEPRLPARERLRWLGREPDGFQPQPYEQLAAWYAGNGQSAQGRQVLHAKERRIRAGRSLSSRVWGLLQDVTVAYGYQPWRAVLWLLGLLAAGSATYAASPPPPLDPAHSPHFNPVAYTIDLLLPVVNLGQKGAYNPSGAEQWLSYALTAAGWILATTIAAGAARTLSRK